MEDATYISALPEFVDKTIKRWARQKKKNLEPKLARNFNAVTNRDTMMKQWKKGEAGSSGKDEDKWRSDTWIGFVRIKVWAFYSTLLDTVMKAGKIPFTLEAQPYDNLDEGMEEDRDNRVERMTSLIQTQLAQRHADREYMNKWLSGGYYGMAFSKFDVDTVKTTVFQQVQMGLGDAQQYMEPEELEQYTRFEMVQDEEDVPGHRYVSVWNMVWDMEGDNLQDSAGYAEHIASSPYDLRQLIDKPGYIKDAIERVIERNRDNTHEKEGDIALSPGKSSILERKQSIMRYEFYMRAPRKIAEEFEKIIKSRNKTEIARLSMVQDYEDAESSGDDIEIMGEIADNEIIRYLRNETGKRPHHMWVVEQNLDENTGTGIADNMEDVQISLVGMIRSFEDNKKLSANVTTAVKKRYFTNPSQLNEIVPGKQYDIADNVDDVRKAILPIVFPDVGESLMSGIRLMMELKDEVSMIPTIMQGFTLPKHQPDTAYEMKRLTENSGKYVGQSIRNNDEQFIEPEIQEIYEYNMVFGEDESCKVNCKVIANGFTSFQNKEIRGERMKQALGLFVSSEVLGPYAEIKPHLNIIYESMDEDPDKFIKSEEKMAQEAKQRAEAEAQAQSQEAEAERAKIEIEAQVKLDEAQRKHENAMQEKEQEHRFKMEQSEQEHVHALEEGLEKAKLDFLYDKKKEVTGPPVFQETQ